ncbi:MAG: hypothetical protein JW891_18065 [Candidatus Lokiarchaeota archaeon]|nr:hypothetical protein [Candidatus Lokiarchaeota archaeon]
MCLENNLERILGINELEIFIDVNNVVHNRHNMEQNPQLGDFLIMMDRLINDLGFQPAKIISICDPGLKYHIDKPNEFEALIKEGVIREAPKVADEFILSFALRKKYCLIVSNDKFREYLDQLPSKDWLKQRRVTFMFLGNDVVLSPNFDEKKMKKNIQGEKPMSKGDDVNCSEEPIEKSFEKSTLEVLKNSIERVEGEFDLF